MRLRKIKVLRRVTGAVRRWPDVVRIAVVEGGRGGTVAGTVRVRVKADRRVGRRGIRRVERCMLYCRGGDVDGVIVVV